MTHYHQPGHLSAFASPGSATKFSLLLLMTATLLGCDDEMTNRYESEPVGPNYQHEISLNQGFVRVDDVNRGITLTGNRLFGAEGNATLRFDIVNDPAQANALFTCSDFSFDEVRAREIDAAERAANAKGTTFRLPLAGSAGYLRIQSLINGPDLNELINIRNAGDKPFRQVHLGFWEQNTQGSDLLRARSSEVVFQASGSQSVQDALNSAYGLVDMFMANSDELYVYLYPESEVETTPGTTTEIYY